MSLHQKNDSNINTTIAQSNQYLFTTRKSKCLEWWYIWFWGRGNNKMGWISVNYYTNIENLYCWEFPWV